MFAKKGAGAKGGIATSLGNASTVMDEFRELSQGAISGVTNLFETKTNRHRNGADEASGRQYADGMEVEAPFEKEQCDWLGDVAGESIFSSLACFAQNFGKRVADRFELVEQKIRDLEGADARTSAKLEALEALVAELHSQLQRGGGASDQALAQRVEAMATQIDAQKQALERAEQSASSSSRAGLTAASEPPYESRTRAVIMHLIPPSTNLVVTDAERKQRMEQCFQKALEVMQQVEVPRELYKAVAALANGKGAEMEFTSYGALALAILLRTTWCAAKSQERICRLAPTSETVV